MKTTPIDAQIGCVMREIAMRERVYPVWIKNGRLRRFKADYEITTMKAVLATLEAVRAQQRPGLFDQPENDIPQIL